MRIIEYDNGPVAFQREIMGSRTNELYAFPQIRAGGVSLLIQSLGRRIPGLRYCDGLGSNRSRGSTAPKSQPFFLAASALDPAVLSDRAAVAF